MMNKIRNAILALIAVAVGFFAAADFVAFGQTTTPTTSPTTVVSPTTATASPSPTTAAGTGGANVPQGAPATGHAQ